MPCNLSTNLNHPISTICFCWVKLALHQVMFCVTQKISSTTQVLCPIQNFFYIRAQKSKIKSHFSAHFTYWKGILKSQHIKGFFYTRKHIILSLNGLKGILLIRKNKYSFTCKGKLKRALYECISLYRRQ